MNPTFSIGGELDVRKIGTTRLMRFVDAHPLRGPVYYALRALNKAGASAFSEHVAGR